MMFPKIFFSLQKSEAHAIHIRLVFVCSNERTEKAFLGVGRSNFVRFSYVQCVTCFERCCRICLARWRVYTREARRVRRSKLGWLPLPLVEVKAVRLSIQQIGRSRLFTGGLNSGVGEEEGLCKAASELPSKRELNLLESRFLSVSVSSSSGSWLSPVGFLPGLRPRAPRVFKEEMGPSPFHPEEGEDSASKK